MKICLKKNVQLGLETLLLPLYKNQISKPKLIFYKTLTFNIL